MPVGSYVMKEVLLVGAVCLVQNTNNLLKEGTALDC